MAVNGPLNFSAPFTPFYAKKGKPSETSSSAETKLFLILDSGSIEHYTKYSKDDLWVICSNPSFVPESRDDLFFIARSIFHGKGR
jgi:hypothetical protein